MNFIDRMRGITTVAANDPGAWGTQKDFDTHRKTILRADIYKKRSFLRAPPGYSLQFHSCIGVIAGLTRNPPPRVSMRA
jgi:hypothetical protein